MQWASSITSRPTRSANSGSISVRNCGLSSRSGLISSRSTASASSSDAHLVPRLAVGRVDGVGADARAAPPPRSGCASAPAAARRSAPARRRARAAARWPGSRRPTCPSPSAARTGRARGRRRGRAPPRAGARGSRRSGPARSRSSSRARASSIVKTVGHGAREFAPLAVESPPCGSWSSATWRAWPASAAGRRCPPASALYDEGRKLYTEEINAAVRGAFLGGRRRGRGDGLPRRRRRLLVQLAARRGARRALRVRGPERVDRVHRAVRAGLRRGADDRHARDGGRRARRDVPHRQQHRLARAALQRHSRSARSASTPRCAAPGAARSRS